MKPSNGLVSRDKGLVIWFWVPDGCGAGYQMGVVCTKWVWWVPNGCGGYQMGVVVGTKWEWCWVPNGGGAGCKMCVWIYGSFL